MKKLPRGSSDRDEARTQKKTHQRGSKDREMTDKEKGQRQRSGRWKTKRRSWKHSKWRGAETDKRNEREVAESKMEKQ
jgi:hypothetical protein